MTDIKNQNIKVNINNEDREVSRDALLKSPELIDKDYEIGVTVCGISLIGSIIALAAIRKTWSDTTFGVIIGFLLMILIYNVINLIRKYLMINKIRQGAGITAQALGRFYSEDEKTIRHLKNGGSIKINGVYKILDNYPTTTNIYKINNGTVIEYSSTVSNDGCEVKFSLTLDNNDNPTKLQIMRRGPIFVAYDDYTINISKQLTDKENGQILNEDRASAYIANFIDNYLRKSDLINQDLQTYEVEKQRLINQYQEAERNAISDTYRVKVGFLNSKLSMDLTVDIPRNISKSMVNTDQSQHTTPLDKSNPST